MAVGSNRWLNPILAKACTADPAKRYPSAARFKRDLLMLQAGKSLGGSSWGSWGAGAVLLITLGWGLGRLVAAAGGATVLERVANR